MRKTLAICLFELKRTLKQPSTYILMLIMPLLFSFLFGSMIGGEGAAGIKIAIVDEDLSAQSEHLIKQLKKEGQLDVQVMKKSEAESEFTNKELEGILLIPQSFGHGIASAKQPMLKLKYSPGSANVRIAKEMINQAVQVISIQTAASKKWSNFSGEDWYKMYDEIVDQADNREDSTSKLVSLQGEEQESQLTGASFSSSGFSIMFVMIMMLIVTGVLIEARKSGVWQRLMATPTSKLQIITGYLLSFFLIGWIQFGLLMISTSFLFDVKWGNSTAAVVLISALLLSIIGLGLAIAGFAKTTEQQSAIGSLIIVSTCMLGGIYWPISIVPNFMQKMAQFVPQYWAMKGFNGLIADNGGITDIIIPISVLLGFAAVFLSIGLTRIKYEA